MIANGKILFFNENDGKGIIITSEKKKLNFSIENWNDFECMPILGLEVYFDLENDLPLDIMSKIEFEKQSTNEADIESINDFTQNQDIEENYYEEDETLKTDVEIEIDYEDIITQEEIEVEKQSIEEDLGPQRDSITISLNISTAVSNYFNKIEAHIKKRAVYKKVDGKLDYILVKRFLNTMYNNLTDIDLHIITPKIKALHNDLLIMGKIYEDFSYKTKHPHIAYKDVFLTCQDEYTKIKDGAQLTIEKLQQLRISEGTMGGSLKVKKDELNDNIDSLEFSALQNELKSLNGAYVDIVHMMAELDERYKNDMKLLNIFEEEYRTDFYDIFKTETLIYRKKLLEILNAQAYIFDMQLWREAKKSMAVKAHFKGSSIKGDLTTKTYLKYYLDSLDSEKTTKESKKLFELYDKLRSEQKEYILIVMSSAEDAIEYETSIRQSNRELYVKSFIDEKNALRFAIQNSINILILEDKLQKTSAERFLHVYQKNIFLTPKIIILGEKPKSTPFPIIKLLSNNASSRVLIDNITQLLENKE